ncbi:MAG: hypothetical protein KAU47_09740 [Candidatus Aminicenantes bacterium]|nr:hypothetical protein [Candidatus Aminicenantes bacterium]MCK4758896.1 hypothetical protein [Candidatus Aminicenantes bacterium]
MENISSFIPHAIVIAATVIGVLYLVASKRKAKTKSFEKDYSVFIVLGAIWLIAGLTSGNSGIWPLGLIFLLSGLAGMLIKKKK